MSLPPILSQQQQQGSGRGAARRQQQPPDPSQPPRQEGLSSSWPSATLRRQLARRPPVAPGKMPLPAAPLSRPRDGGASPRAPPPRPLQQPRPLWRSCESMNPPGRRASPPQVREEAGRPPAPEEPLLRFSLRLTPEAALVLQRRHLEKQLSARRPPGPGGAPLPSCPRRVFACSRRGSPPGPRGGPQPPQELLLKISLLNERHRYDDVEYEEEETSRPPDEGLVRRCTEWLRGVESAAAPDRLQSLPHLSLTQ
ncbi:proline-rich protein 18 [Ambystoma mexicanum]|uniref:proline-rich protein 18 n=1 Tax=Ambystoma mexicanum TaxID=8296 RepID=UPI0037E809C7